MNPRRSLEKEPDSQKGQALAKTPLPLQLSDCGPGLDRSHYVIERPGMTFANMQEEAMRLSNQERAELLDWLWETLQSEDTLQIQGRWVAETEKRIDAVDQGTLPTVNGPRAMQDLRRSLGR